MKIGHCETCKCEPVKYKCYCCGKFMGTLEDNEIFKLGTSRHYMHYGCLSDFRYIVNKARKRYQKLIENPQS